MSAPSALGDRIEQLNQAARDGDVGAIYEVIRMDANILEAIDAIPFVDTPLHESALAGGAEHIRFAIEMMWLKPSFSWKLNPDGFSPVHLALRGGHTRMVRELLQFDADLVREKGRECRTPLHVVAEKLEQYDLLVEFLSVCPNSIEDVTIQNQTALHIALESNNMKAFEHLVSCLEKFGSEKALKILNWLDENGRTVFRAAVFKKNPKAVQLLLDFGAKLMKLGVGEEEVLVKYDRITFDDSGCCHYMHRSDNYEYVLKVICERSQILRKTVLSFRRFFVRLRLLGQTACVGSIVSNDDRDVLLVVAALLITISHQAASNSSGGVRSENQPFGCNPPAAAPAAGVEFFAGAAIGQPNFPHFGFIAMVNYIIFTLSTIMTFLLLPGGYISALFKMALVQLWVSYFYSLTVIIPSVWVFLFCLSSTGLCLFLVFIAFVGNLFSGARAKRLRLDLVFYMGYFCSMFAISFAFIRGFYSKV